MFHQSQSARIIDHKLSIGINDHLTLSGNIFKKVSVIFQIYLEYL